jgi:hypothetical protein
MATTTIRNNKKPTSTPAYVSLKIPNAYSMDHEIGASPLPASDLLISWLSTANDWIDPNGFEQPQGAPADAQKPTLTATPPTSQSPQHQDPHLSSFRSRKRRRVYISNEMDRNSETASNASASSPRTTATSPFSLRHRQILNPTPPSTRQRSPSPTRRVLTQLRYANPPLKLCQPDVRVVEPAMVRDLTSTLVEAMSMGVIPIGLKVQILDFLGCNTQLRSRTASTPKTRPHPILVPKSALRDPSYRIYTHPPLRSLAHNGGHLQ